MSHRQSQMSTDTREDSVYLAKLAEQAERYEGMYYLLVDAPWCLMSRVCRDGREHEARCFV